MLLIWSFCRKYWLTYMDFHCFAIQALTTFALLQPYSIKWSQTVLGLLAFPFLRRRKTTPCSPNTTYSLHVQQIEMVCVKNVTLQVWLEVVQSILPPHHVAVPFYGTCSRKCYVMALNKGHHLRYYTVLSTWPEDLLMNFSVLYITQD